VRYLRNSSVLACGLVSIALAIYSPLTFGQDTWIYTDSLDSSWILNPGGLQITQQDTEQVYGGTYSFKVVVPQWKQPSFHHGPWGAPVHLDPNNYSAFEFYIYPLGGTAKVYVHASNDSVIDFQPSNPSSYSAPESVWTKISIPMSAFPFNGHLFDMLNFQEGSAGGRTWYLDEMRLVGPISSVEQPGGVAPIAFALRQNFPNPFNPSTMIQFDLPGPATVTLKVTNILGEEVATLVAGQLAGGRHEVQWSASGLASGVYVYQLRTRNVIETKKMLLLR
jgi:hypothetical protein